MSRVCVVQLQGSCISAGYLKMGKHPPLCKRPLHYFDSIILNENYPMQSPTSLQIVACLAHHAL